MSSEHQWRYYLVGFVFALSGLLVVGQLIRLQFIPEAEDLRIQGEAYRGSYQEIQPARGQIYDRWGNLLAVNQTVYEIGVSLEEVEDRESIAFALNVVLEKDYGEVLERISPDEEDNFAVVYLVLADFVSPEKVHELQSLPKQLEYLGENNPVKDLTGLVFSPHLQRSYPEKDLAANILGFVSRDGNGYFGVEARYDALLAGAKKLVWMPSDPNLVEQMPDIPPGASVVLTIDRQIQAMVEDVLDQSVATHSAEAGTIVVTDPKTGEILAMASTPRIDPNLYWEYSEQITGRNPFNRAVSKDYEPGSVYKVLTMAAALDAGVVEPSTEFIDTGLFEIGGAQIRNWNLGAWGSQTMIGCLQHSLNVCHAWLASEMGPTSFYSYMRDFGIGHTTGVDLAGEIGGRLKTPGDGDWYEADLGTNSFGQGLSATPVQMVMAVSALANDGKMMVPHILRSLINNGNQYDPPPQVAGTPISAETARTITNMLAQSLESEASRALVPGYRLAGKTGTAEIPTPYGYTMSQTNVSFVGWGPADDPQFLVYIWLEKPATSIWGSEVAAPVFREVVQKLVVLMRIPPDDVRAQLAGQ